MQATKIGQNKGQSRETRATIYVTRFQRTFDIDVASDAVEIHPQMFCILCQIPAAPIT